MNEELRYTTDTAPARLKELGRTGADGKLLEPVSVRALARQYGIGQKLARDWLFSERDLEKMAALPGPGRPWVSAAGDAPASLEAANDAPPAAGESEPPDDESA